MSDTIEQMRNALKPSGTAPVVGLHLSDRFFHVDFITKCIDELERMPIRSAIGELPTNLEKLAFELLMDSAYIQRSKNEQNDIQRIV